MVPLSTFQFVLNFAPSLTGASQNFTHTHIHTSLQIAFVSLTLFNMLRSPMTLLANLITMLVQVSSKENVLD